MCLAIPGRIVELSEEPQLATVEVSGVRRRVNIGLVAPDGVEEGDWVLIHVGFAMSVVSEEDVQEQIRLLSMMGESQDALEEIRGYRFDDEDQEDA